MAAGFGSARLLPSAAHGSTPSHEVRHGLAAFSLLFRRGVRRARAVYMGSEGAESREAEDVGHSERRREVPTDVAVRLDGEKGMAAEGEEVVARADLGDRRECAPRSPRGVARSRSQAARRSTGAAARPRRAREERGGPPSCSASAGRRRASRSAAGTMTSGKVARSVSMRSRSTIGRSSVTYPTRRRSSGGSSRATTTACRTPPTASIAASISPSSMRWPRILTWLSARPRKSMRPSSRRHTRSPVRYIRPLAREAVGQEALGGQLGPPPVAAGDAVARDEQLARERRPAPARAPRRARRAGCWRSACRC